MSTLTIGVLLFIFMLVLMAIRVPIAVAMFIPGAIGYWAMSGDLALLNLLNGSAVGEGAGRSTKEAEQMAAKDALEKLTNQR